MVREQLSVKLTHHPGSIVIYRVEPNGRRHLYTRTAFPKTKGWDKAVDQFAQQLGEHLLMDSAVARKLLEL